MVVMGKKIIGFMSLFMALPLLAVEFPGFEGALWKYRVELADTAPPFQTEFDLVMRIGGMKQQEMFGSLWTVWTCVVEMNKFSVITQGTIEYYVPPKEITVYRWPLPGLFVLPTNQFEQLIGFATVGIPNFGAPKSTQERQYSVNGGEQKLIVSVTKLATEIIDWNGRRLEANLFEYRADYYLRAQMDSVSRVERWSHWGKMWVETESGVWLLIEGAIAENGQIVRTKYRITLVEGPNRFAPNIKCS